jgi:hypothetical protein
LPGRRPSIGAKIKILCGRRFSTLLDHSAFVLGMALLPHLEGLFQASAWYDGATPTAVVKEI